MVIAEPTADSGTPGEEVFPVPFHDDGDDFKRAVHRADVLNESGRYERARVAPIKRWRDRSTA